MRCFGAVRFAAILVVCNLTLTPWSGVDAGVFRQRLENLVATTPVVLLTEVTAVEGLSRGDWKATGRVLEVWKGPQREIVSYGPAGHGDPPACEASAARVGETVVLFLEPENQTSAFLRIAFVGYGRLPVYSVEGKQFVEANAFFLPPDISASQVFANGQTREVVPLNWLRNFVKTPVSRPSQDGR